MPDEILDDEAQAKSPVLKIILIVVGVLLLVAITVGGTLFASGFFAPDTAQDPEAAIAALEAAADEEAAAAAAAAAGPSKVQLDSPELLKFQQSYYQLEKELVVNIANSRKVMQASIAIMTHYDDRVVDNVEKHTFPLRNAMLTVMSQQTDASITSPDFRKNLSEELKIVMNAKLEELEDFGGIEAVYLTEFVVQ
ncbi:MAG: flagellar basal body-associated FliL family protein [Porticoccaceae bacterium]|jgi:flagellar FliL protein|tara:strand:+ start:744 stop:1328 length:585 start_codon:yes stop_codon:yes gene_type:complete